MSSPATVLGPGSAAPQRSSLYWTIADSLVLTRRNLLQYVRVPELLIFSTIQPVMFVLLFAIVFGGAIQTPGMSYINYLMPGIFIQTAVFGALTTGVGLAEDLNRGMIDRFRSLPMARSAVLAGRTSADLIRNIFVVLLMTVVGMLIGFQLLGGIPAAILGLIIVALFGYSFSWVSSVIGLAVKDVEAVQSAGFIWVFPLTFVSSAFVPVSSMPTWLQPIANANPVTIAVNAVRGLMNGYADWAMVLAAFGWIAVILAVFVPLGVRSYRRIA